MAGNSAGRFFTSGGDRMGRFCWYTVQGNWDEGIIVITAYRVCDESSPGPLTAYREQHRTLRNEEIRKPNARKDILSALTDFIESKRQEGYRLVLMMDANGNYMRPKGDKDLREFIRSTSLVDHY